MDLYFILSFLIVLITILQCNCDNRVAERQLITSLLDPKKYDARIRAYEHNTSGATNVNVSLYLHSVKSVDDLSMVFRVQLNLKLQWQDTRLSYSDKTQGQSYPYLTLDSNSDKIWIPDLFFPNEMQANVQNLLKSATYKRIHPDGRVIYSTRMSLTLSCPMDLKLFPMDKPFCSIRAASLKWTIDDIVFKWHQDDPVFVSSDLIFPKFAIEKYSAEYCDSYVSTGVYSCLRADFTFSRQFSYYFVHAYIPTAMLVIVGWLSFWISNQQCGIARLLFSVHNLLILVIITALLNANFPATSYTKAIDTWTGTCLIFVFGSVIIGVIVTYAKGDEKEDKVEPNSTPRKSLSPRELLKKFSSCRTSKIDIGAKILYPIGFLLFNVIYWNSY